MREIKFRGWCEKYKQWIYGYPEIAINPLGKSRLFIHSFSDWNLNSTTDCDIDSLGEYTGLKDKNGKEIYEGDIVKATNKYNSTPTKRPTYEVIFENGAFCGISLKRHSVQGRGLRTLKLCFDDTQEMETAEIIGNIYENPELLK